MSGVIIVVNRSDQPSYPEWKVGLADPEFELAGPGEFVLNRASLWVHEEQRSGELGGYALYHHLTAVGLLGSCLNLQDGLAIAALGVPVYRESIGCENAAFLWRSVAVHRGGKLTIRESGCIGAAYPEGITADRESFLAVPYLYVCGNAVLVGWFFMYNKLCHKDLTLLRQ